MTDKQKLDLAAVKARKELRELALSDDATAEQIEKATRKLNDLEARAAALPADTEPVPNDPADGEARERRALIEKADLARCVAAELDGREFRGAEAELAAAENCPGYVPMVLLDGTPEEREAAEKRAATEAPSVVGSHLHPTLPGVFLPRAAEALRVDMPRVGAGTQSFPVVSTDLSARARDKGVAGPEVAGAVTVSSASFKRISGSFRISYEDIQKMPSLTSDFRANLSAVLSDAVDSLVVNGQAAVANKVEAIPGFFSATSPVVTAAASESDSGTFATYVQKTLAGLDGKYASTLRDMTLVCAPEVVTTMAQKFQTGTAESALSYIQGLIRGVVATDRISESSGVSPAMIVRHSVPGRVAVAPTWSGFKLVTDQYSAAASGQIVVTAILMQSGVKILRSGAYSAVSFKTA